MTLDKIEALLASGACHSVYVGHSVVKDNPRFATLTTGAGETVARGKGATATAALEDAISKLNKRPVVITTQPAMPGFTRTAPAMPSFGAK